MTGRVFIKMEHSEYELHEHNRILLNTKQGDTFTRATIAFNEIKLVFRRFQTFGEIFNKPNGPIHYELH